MPEGLLGNAVNEAKITGAQDMAKILNLVCDSMSNHGFATLSIGQIRGVVDSSVKEYELKVRRGGL